MTYINVAIFVVPDGADDGGCWALASQFSFFCIVATTSSGGGGGDDETRRAHSHTVTTRSQARARTKQLATGVNSICTDRASESE